MKHRTAKVLKRKRVHGYTAPGTTTKASPIHGWGLFAQRTLKRGTVVAAWGAGYGQEKN